MYKADGGKIPLARIVYADDGQVVAAGGNFDGVFIPGGTIGAGIDHIGQYEGRAALFKRAGHVAERLAYVGAVALGLPFQNLAQNVQKVAAALCRGDELFYLVAEEQGANLIVVDDGAEGQHCSDLCGKVTFGAHRGAEKA